MWGVILPTGLLVATFPSIPAPHPDCGQDDGIVTGTIKWSRCTGEQGYASAWSAREWVWQSAAVRSTYGMATGPVCQVNPANCPGYPPDAWAFGRACAYANVCGWWCLIDPRCGGPFDD